MQTSPSAWCHTSAYLFQGGGLFVRCLVRVLVALRLPSALGLDLGLGLVLGLPSALPWALVLPWALEQSQVLGLSPLVSPAHHLRLEQYHDFP